MNLGIFPLFLLHLFIFKFYLVLWIYGNFVSTILHRRFWEAGCILLRYKNCYMENMSPYLITRVEYMINSPYMVAIAVVSRATTCALWLVSCLKTKALITSHLLKNRPKKSNLVTKWREQVTAEAVSFGITVVNSAAETGVQRQESRKCVAIKEEPKIHVKNEIVEGDEEFGSSLHFAQNICSSNPCSLDYYIPTPIKSISPSERHKQKTVLNLYFLNYI